MRLEKRAKRLGISKSDLVRESVQKALQTEGAAEVEASTYDLMKDRCGCVDRGIDDLFANPKHMAGFGR